jgi:hypothetical protein
VGSRREGEKEKLMLEDFLAGSQRKKSFCVFTLEVKRTRKRGSAEGCHTLGIKATS